MKQNMYFVYCLKLKKTNEKKKKISQKFALYCNH